jgi:hypothetical protein
VDKGKMLTQTVIASTLAGTWYRFGGASKEWFALANTKWRDLGVPLVICLSIPFHWSLGICFLLSFGSMTLYWKRHGTDAQWYNWALTGFFYTVAFLPYFYLTNTLMNWLLCCVTVTSLVTIWSEFIDLDWLEEFGRWFITAYLLILFSKSA